MTDIQDKMDAELDAAEQAAVPAEDPGIPQPIFVTPVQLFTQNFVAIYAAFGGVSGLGTTIKSPVATILLQEAAKYAFTLTQQQMQLIAGASK